MELGGWPEPALSLFNEAVRLTETTYGEELTLAFHKTNHVLLNDGQTEDNVAIVLHDNGGGDLDLYPLEGVHQGSVLKNVPRRDKGDYDQAGGGRTWHL